jgi:hypothetical protein
MTMLKAFGVAVSLTFIALVFFLPADGYLGGGF